MENLYPETAKGQHLIESRCTNVRGSSLYVKEAAAATPDSAKSKIDTMSKIKKWVRTNSTTVKYCSTFFQ